MADNFSGDIQDIIKDKDDVIAQLEDKVWFMSYVIMKSVGGKGISYLGCMEAFLYARSTLDINF